jgi:hypothetical protein
MILIFFPLFSKKISVLWKTHSLIMRDVSVYFLLLFVHIYLCTRVGDGEKMYPYTVTDDRVGRSKKRKDDGKEFFRRDCMRKFSYHIPSLVSKSYVPCICQYGK